MFKLFKEVFKSLAKSKILMICLSTLVFLSSTVFTLFSTINSSYTNQFNKYKNVSKMQDLTVDLNFNNKNKEPNKFYNNTNLTFYNDSFKGNDQLNITIPKNLLLNSKMQGDVEKYLKASYVFDIDVSNDFYISATQFYTFIKNNAQIETFLKNQNLSIPNTIINVGKENFNPYVFQKFKEPGIPFPSTKSIVNTSTVLSSFQNNNNTDAKLSDLVKIIPGSDGWLNKTSDQISNVKNIYFNTNTKEASLSISKKTLWQKENSLLIISSDEVAKYLGYTISDSRLGIYSYDSKLNATNFFNPLSTSRGIIRLNPNSTFKTTFNLGVNGVKPTNWSIEKEIKPLFNYHNLLKINTDWLTRNKIISFFSNDLKTLNYDFENDNNIVNDEWSGEYKNFIEQIKTNTDLRKKYQTLTTWKKTYYIFETDPEGNIIDKSNFTTSIADITLEDLTLNIKPTLNSNFANKDIVSLALESKILTAYEADEIRKNKNSKISKQFLEKITNLNNGVQQQEEIKELVNKEAYNQIFNNLENLVGEENMSIRETSSLSSQTNVFGIVNMGDENQEISFGENSLSSKNVGELFNEANGNKSNLFNESLVFNPRSYESLKNFTPDVIEKIFSGYSLDFDYLNPSFYFGSYSFFDPKTNKNKTVSSQKIVLLKKKNKNGNIEYAGITLNNSLNQYVLLSPKGKPFVNWDILPVDYNFLERNINSLNDLVFNKGWEFSENDLNLEKNNLIGINGWAKQDNSFTNKYFVPLKLIIPSSEILEDFNNGNGFRIFTDGMQAAFSNILKDKINPDQIKILTDAVNKSFTENGFADGLVPPAVLKTNALLKVVFGILYEAAIYDDKDFWSNFFKSILSSDQETFNKTIKSIEIVLKNSLGINLGLIDLLKKLLIDETKIFDSLSNIITSINLDDFFISFYEKYYSVDDSSKSLGIGDYLPILLENVDEVNFKKSLKDLILNINYETIFNNLLDTVPSEFVSIIKKMNAYKPGNIEGKKPYQNVGEGLSELIEYLSIEDLIVEVKNTLFIEEFTIMDSNNNPKKISVNTMKTSDLISSFLVSISPDGQNNDFILDSLIKLANISNKTSSILGVYQPTVDPDKLGIYDLTSLLVSKTPIIIKDKELLNSTLNKIKNGGNINSLQELEKEILEKYIILETENINSITTNEVIARIESCLKVLNSSEFNSFDITKGIEGQGAFSSNSRISLADKLMELIHPTTVPDDFDKVLKQPIYDQFFHKGNPIQSHDMLTEMLNFYNFWLSMSKQLLENDIDPIVEINKLLTLLKDNNNEITKVLNQKKHSFTMILITKKINDGFTQPKNVAIELAKITERQLKNNETLWINKNVLNYFFDIDANNNVRYNSRTFSLVSSLTLITTTNLDRFVTTEFQNTFLHGKNHKENLTNINLALKMQDWVNGPTYSILENVGLSSTVMSAFSGILNPYVVLWYTVNQEAESTTDLGNMQFILKERIFKINSDNNSPGAINKEGIKKIIDSFIDPNTLVDKPFDPLGDIPLVMDIETIRNLILNLKDPNTGENLEFLGIDFANFIEAAIDPFIEIRLENNIIVTNNITSYFAKVNPQYLHANKKTPFVFSNNSSIPKYSKDMQDFVNDPKNEQHVININGLNYLIIGDDLTADYLYPVIDSSHTQIDFNTQAIVYLNEYGFDRVLESNANIAINKYLLMRKGKYQKDLSSLQKEVDLIIYNALNGTNFTEHSQVINIDKFSYLNSEQNILYPERSMRIIFIEEMLETVNIVNFWVSIFLIVLIGILITFIIKRFIFSKARVFGILKAQGYSKIQIASSITIIGIVAISIGTFFGYLTGFFMQMPIMNILSSFWTVPIQPLTFSWIPFIINILVPIIGVSLMIIIISMLYLRKNTLSLINESFELNKSKTAEAIKYSIRGTSIKNKFAVALSLNSIPKLLSLLIVTTLSSSISIFSIASGNGFNDSVSTTYANREYEFRIDLTTPTKESGLYTKIGKEQNKEHKTFNNIEDMLFVPNGNPEEGATQLADYFRPGVSSVINTFIEDTNNPGNLISTNGNPDPWTPHIISKSSLDLSVLTTAIVINTWESLYNSLPEAQQKSIVEFSQEAGPYLERTQDIIFPTDDNYFALDKNGNKVSYFKYIKDLENPTKSRFIYMLLNSSETSYSEKEIIIGGTDTSIKNLRNIYRDFLVNGYSKMLSETQSNIMKQEELMNESKEDFFIMFGGVKFDPLTNETYSRGEFTTIKNLNPINIYGYKTDSCFVKITDDYDNNLLMAADDFYNKNNKGQNKIYPLIVNKVVAEKNGYSKGDKITLNLENSYNRNLNKIKNVIEKKEDSKEIIEFEIIGVNNTYINEEYTSTQAVINDILNMQPNENQDAFNGILSKSESPSILTNTLSLYSESNYWAGDNEIDINYNVASSTSSTKQRARSIFLELYYKNKDNQNTSVVAKNIRKIYGNINSVELMQKIEDIAGFTMDTNLDGLLSMAELSSINDIDIQNALIEFTKIYGSKILNPVTSNVSSKNIESGFSSNVSTTINSITSILLIFGALVSMITLIMISTLIVNENERNIAIFGIMAYSKKERARIFLSIYFPILFLGVLLSIPIALGAITLFQYVILSTTLTFLPIGLNAINIIGGSLFVLVIFSMSLLISWYNINKIKPISLLGGK